MKHVTAAAGVTLKWTFFGGISVGAVKAVLAGIIGRSAKAIHATNAGCGTLMVKNMKDVESYLLRVKDFTSGTCSFPAEGLTFFYPQNHGATGADNRTVDSFAPIGHEVVVAWAQSH